jgi:hypothetical protein
MMNLVPLPPPISTPEALARAIDQLRLTIFTADSEAEAELLVALLEPLAQDMAGLFNLAVAQLKFIRAGAGVV